MKLASDSSKALASITPDKSVLNKFVNGDLPILCQVGKLSEGFDMPELDMCINYPTCSRVVEAQRGGRVLRLNPQNQSKFSLIVDIVFPIQSMTTPFYPLMPMVRYCIGILLEKA